MACFANSFINLQEGCYTNRKREHRIKIFIIVLSRALDFDIWIFVDIDKPPPYL